MALKKCAKCGHQITNDVPVCPNCGAPVVRREKPGPAKFVALFLVIAAGLALAVFIRTRETVVPVESISAAPAVDLQKTKTQAESGDANAQNTLGEIYGKGEGVPLDYKEAAKWYRLAAAQGHLEAENHLAQLFEVGQGVPRDEAEAAKLYHHAAEKGHVGAQYSLGAMFTAGRGVKPSDTEAVKWYRLAAEQGDSLAQFNLGQRSIAGKGLPQDPVEAYKWLGLASAQGLPDATQALDRLKKTMSSKQIADGQRLVEGITPKKQNPAR